ncbi:MAG: choice-of-anchor E domain-containing protein [Fimbriimonadaceae bacterium]|nr:choice-of-anchor E domain-containing protein [Fimbriimonadaceae bacterium]
MGKPLEIAVSCLVLGIGLASTAHAQSITQKFPFSFTPSLTSSGREYLQVNNLAYNGFNPALGTLKSVYIKISYKYFFRNGWENTDVIPKFIAWEHIGDAGLGWNDGPFDYVPAIQAVTRTDYVSPLMGPYDGKINQFGASGFRVDHIGAASQVASITATSPNFTRFIGNEAKEIQFYSRLTVFVRPDNHAYFGAKVNGTVQITYFYTPAP